MNINNMLIMTVKCENINCVYKEEPFKIHIIFTNNSDKSLFIPLEILKKRGASILLTNENGKEIQIPTSLASSSLLKELTEIPPKQKVSFSETINKNMIENMKYDNNISIIVNIAISTRIYTTTQLDEFIPFKKEIDIHIKN